MDPLKLNKAIEAIFQLLFLNTAISTLFWIFLPSLTKYFPSIPFAFVCYPLGFCCFLIARIRQKIPISDWSREVVVLTGGSHGIGARLCDILLEKGAKVIVIDRMKPLTEKALWFKCDLSNPKEILSTTREIKSKCGNPTMLVNNAGIVNGKSFLDTDVDAMEMTFKVNVFAHFYLCKEFLSGMIEKRRGHILSVSSVMGRTGGGHAVDYSASKFAVTGYVESLRQELYGTGVHVSMIFPGLIDTGMFDGVAHKMPYLTPLLDIETVAQEMFDILRRNRSQEVPLPFYVRFSPLLRMLPVELNDFIHRITGANDDLKSYKGSVSQSKHEKNKKAY